MRQELSSREELRQFLEGQDERVLTVLNLSVLSAAGCIHIFPAILALARNFQVCSPTSCASGPCFCP